MVYFGPLIWVRIQLPQCIPHQSIKTTPKLSSTQLCLNLFERKGLSKIKQCTLPLPKRVSNVTGPQVHILPIFVKSAIEFLIRQFSISDEQNPHVKYRRTYKYPYSVAARVSQCWPINSIAKVMIARLEYRDGFPISPRGYLLS